MSRHVIWFYGQGGHNKLVSAVSMGDTEFKLEVHGPYSYQATCPERTDGLSFHEYSRGK